MALTPEAGERKWLNNWEAWVADCAAKHGGRYTYPSNKREKNPNGQGWLVQIECPDHGIFLQAPNKHKFGQGCPYCSGRKSQDTAHEWLRKTYPGIAWNAPEDFGSKDVVQGVCKDHGTFDTTLNRLRNKLAKGGKEACPRCARIEGGLGRRLSVDDVTEKIKRLTGCDLDVTTYDGVMSYVRVVCPEHGPWTARAQDLLQGHGCGQCWKVSHRSKGEQEILDWVEDLGLNPVPNLDFTAYFGARTECDVAVMLDGRLILIDFHGAYFHGDKMRADTHWHQHKFWKLNMIPGCQYIQIMEDDWAFKQDIVKSRLLNVFGLSVVKLYARKLKIQKITWVQAKEFLATYHLQGAGAATSTNYALVDGDEIVACATFSIPRFSVDHDFELVRFATRGTVVGALGRLLAHFKREHDKAKTLLTYVDNMWSFGQTYQNLGFVFEGFTKQGYSWYKNLKKVSRYQAQRKQLAKWLDSYDSSKTEDVNMREAGYWKVYDAGNSRFVLHL